MRLEFTDPNIQHKNRLSPRADLVSFNCIENAILADKSLSENYYLLNGSFDFYYCENPNLIPDGFYKETFTKSDKWSTIDIPSLWQMQGYGTPVYSPVPYCFPVDPPHVPNENPVGCYLRKFNLPDNFKGKRITINFDGVDSAFVVWINGAEVGFSKGSHMPAEFDITDYLKEDIENLLAIEVYQWSDASYLDLQDMWHMSGIFRDVYLTATDSNAYLKDIYITANHHGNIEIKSSIYSKKNSKYSIEYSLYYKENLIHKTTNTNFKIDNALTWCCEKPNLYKLIIALTVNNNTSYYVQSVGFRSVEIRGEQLFINDAPVKLKGVNRHDTHTILGSMATMESMKQDVILMKQHNINTVRTSHYPNDIRFYELCNEYGIYVIDEADIECHGMLLSGNWSALSQSPDWKNAYLDRGIRMIMRDRNQPSVIIWSIGNESGYGENHKELVRLFKEQDNRPILYEGGRDTGNFNLMEMYQSGRGDEAIAILAKIHSDTIFDIDSKMYPSVSDVINAAKSDDTRPFFLVEYAHAMGNSPGSLSEFWDAFYEYPKLLGGCIWEWAEHALTKKNNDGSIHYLNGDDFNNMPPFSLIPGTSIGNFCNDGLLHPTRRARAGLLEYKHVISPVQVRDVDIKNGYIKIINRHEHSTLEDYDCYYSIMQHGDIIQCGNIAIDIARGESKTIKIDFEYPQKGEAFINFKFTLNKNKNWCNSGFLVYEEQFVLPELKADIVYVNTSKTKYDLHSNFINGHNFEASFDRNTGNLNKWSVDGVSQILTGFDLCFWRATIDNDIKIAQQWIGMGLDRLKPRLSKFSIEENDKTVSVIVEKTWAAMALPPYFKSCMIYTFYGNGAFELITTVDLLIPKIPYIPRIGLQSIHPKSFDRVTYFGRGSHENYADKKCSAMVDLYNTRVLDMHEDYMKPQENGGRCDVRWIALSNILGTGILVQSTDYLMQFSAHNYTSQDIEKLAHNHEIVHQDYTVLNIDFKQSGLGSASVGPMPLEEYQVNLSKQVKFTTIFKPVKESAGSFVNYSKILYK